MSKYSKRSSGHLSNSGEALRFAHPFYTTIPAEKRNTIPGVGRRMTDYIQTKLEPIPKPFRDPVMDLASIIGATSAAAIATQGFISFHTAGDSGNAVSPMPEIISKAMAADYNINKPSSSPAFFFHLGDVNYYANNDTGYHAQFYTAYKEYPGKIIAIPGNHDGELFKYDGTSSGQKTTLEAFQKNFCQPVPGVPPAAGSIFREMISQPAVYWILNTPFVDIIGLYSNVAENPGYISSPQIGQAQKAWLVKTLTAIQATRKTQVRKALIIAVHHPPIAAAGGHSSSTEMLADIDDACNQSGIMPDAVLAAHAHNYQRFTRLVTFKNKKIQIPFIVCGTAGRGIVSVAKADGKLNGDHIFNKSLMDYGYLLVNVSAKLLTMQFFQVSNTGAKKLFDSVIVNLQTNMVK